MSSKRPSHFKDKSNKKFKERVFEPRNEEICQNEGKGSFPLDEIKLSPDYARRIEMDGPKRKYALCFGYLGSNYQGLQINPDALSVEAVLERALLLCGGIQEYNFGNLQKLQWTRAARTDKGVHAVSQCCAMKLTLPLAGREAFIDSLNSFLPADIRAHGMTRVTKSFNAKIYCARRRYHYLLPTYVLQTVGTMAQILGDEFTTQGPIKGAAAEGGYADPNSSSFLCNTNLAAARKRIINYRVDQDRRQLLADALKCYEGTHMFHNFTVGKTCDDLNARRFILSFDCGEPFVDPLTQVEWIQLSVFGQSFLLNQIRRMVSVAVDVARGQCDKSVIAGAFSDDKVDMPMVPGLGLYLDQLSFEGYNAKQTTTNAANQSRKAKAGEQAVASKSVDVVVSSADTIATATTEKISEDKEKDEGEGEEGQLEHEVIDWQSHAVISKHMTDFRQGTIWTHILHEEEKSLAFMYYLDYLRVYPHLYHTRAAKKSFVIPKPQAQAQAHTE